MEKTKNIHEFIMFCLYLVDMFVPKLQDRIRTGVLPRQALTDLDEILYDIVYISDNLLPDKEKVDKMLEELKRETFSKKENFEINIEHYAQEQHKRLYKSKIQWKGIEGYEYPLNVCLEFYLHLLGEETKAKILKFLDELRIKELSWKAGYALLKEAGVLIKMANSVYDKDWIYFVDLHMLYGFNLGVLLTPEEIIDKIHAWGVGQKESNMSLTERRVYKEHIVSVLSNRNSAKKQISLSDWLDNPYNWITAGSSRGIRVELLDTRENRYVQSAGKKAAFALTYTKQEIERKMFSSNLKEVYTSSVKIEVGGKGRMIISAPFINNLRMARLSEIIDKAANYFGIIILMNTKQIESMYNQGVDLLNKGYWALPLDAEKFDYNVATTELELVFDAMEMIISQHSVNIDDDMRLIKIVRSSFYSNIKFKSIELQWQHGVPSGIRWTTLIDTLVSIARALFIKGKIMSLDHVERKRVLSVDYFTIVSIWSLGDDIVFWTNNYLLCALVVHYYGVYEWPVNKIKNFCSRNLAEFLRNVVNKKGVNGYPSRKIASILFAKPEGVMSDRMEKLSEMIDNYNVLTTRYIDREKVLNLIRFEVNASLSKMLARNNIFYSDLNFYLNLSINLGGLFGLGSETEGYTLETVKTRRFRYDHGWGCFHAKRINTLNCLRAFNVPPGAMDDWLAFDLGAMVVPDGLENVLFEEVTEKRISFHFTSLFDAKIADMTIAFDEFRVKENMNIFPEAIITLALGLEDIHEGRRLVQNIMSEELILCESFMWHKCSREVWKDWVKNKLKLKIPVIIGYSRAQVGRFAKKLIKLFFSRITYISNYRKINTKDFQNMFLNIEKMTFNLFNRDVVPVFAF